MSEHHKNTFLGRRYFSVLTLAFVIGIYFALRFPISKVFFTNFLQISLLLLGALFLLCSLAGLMTRSFSGFFLIWFMLLFCILGILRVYVFDNLQYADLMAHAGAACRYDGMITEDPTPSSTQKTLGFSVRIFAMHEETEEKPIQGSIKLYADPASAAALKRGDRITFTAKLQNPETAPYPGGYSYHDALRRQNLCFSAYAKELAPCPEKDCPYTFTERLQGLGLTIQKSILNAIDQSFGSVTEESALLKGILMGIRDDFTPEQYQSFADSGLIHITAVSGMHVMFLSSFLFFLSRALRLKKRIANLCLIPVLILFAAATAFTPSVCRSVIMMLLFLLSMLVQKEPDSLTSLSAAAFLLLLINPYTLTSYSFLLSFSSTLGILLFATPLTLSFKHLFHKTPSAAPQGIAPLLARIAAGAKEQVLASVSMSVASNIGVGYFSARFFQRINWGSLFANIAILPLGAYSFVLGLIHWVVYLLCPPLARLIAAFLLRPPLFLMNQIAKFFSNDLFLIPISVPPESFLPVYGILCLILLIALRPAPSDRNKTSAFTETANYDKIEPLSTNTTTHPGGRI